ncbi:MAG: hypothetical protein U0325_27455 [Polyangiales bacterium]
MGVEGDPIGAGGSGISVAEGRSARLFASRIEKLIVAPGGTMDEKLNCPHTGAKPS